MDQGPGKDSRSRTRAERDRMAAEVGGKIRRFRELRNMPGRELAEAAELGGVSYLSRVESGQMLPSIVAITKIAEALNILPSDLLPDQPVLPTGAITTAYLRAQGMPQEEAERLVAEFRAFDASRPNSRSENSRE